MGLGFHSVKKKEALLLSAPVGMREALSTGGRVGAWVWGQRARPVENREARYHPVGAGRAALVPISALPSYLKCFFYFLFGKDYLRELPETNYLGACAGRSQRIDIEGV